MSDGTIDRTVLPIRRAPFAGETKKTLEGSIPDWNQAAQVSPPEGAPNVLVVLIDDAGFGNPSTFGGAIDTPNYTRMADEGLRYNRFHVTAVCSPTRAAMLTGRNQHRVGFGLVAEFSGPFPGYNATIPRDCATLPRILQENGYMTSAIGKWHLTPDNQQGSSGPFNRWPSGLGFDYYWGFLGGEAGQYDPVITENQKVQGVPEGKDGKPYYFPDDMAEKAMDWLHRVRAERPEAPWFMYYATGCSHAPHHVPREWSDKYAGRFDHGWDVEREETLARQKELGVVPPDTELPDNDAFPKWDSLSETEKRLYARQMETYAGYSENADWNVGRVLDAIEEMGELDNTLVIWIWGDNGASMEGTLSGTFNEMTTLNGIPLTTEQQMGLLFKHGGLEAWGGELLAPHYASAWAWASNCPFDWGKQVASHLGGTRDPLVIRYPRAIADPGAIRSHFTHVIDIAPTVLEIAGIPAPSHVDGIEQEPLHGLTFADSLSDASAPERHTQQYFEAVGNRAMYKDGWWLAMRLPRIPWLLDPEALRHFGPGWDPDDDPVELYYLPDDFSQTHDLAEKHPEKVAELRQLFWEEAERYQVLPILGGLSSFYGIVPPIPKVSTVHVSRAAGEHRGRDDPAHLQPLVHDQRRPRRPGRRRRRGDRGRVRPPGRLRALRTGRNAQAPLLDARRARIHTGGRDSSPEWRRQRRDGLRRRRAEAGDRGRGDVARQRGARCVGADGAHRPCTVFRLRRHGHRVRQRPRRRPQLRGQGAVPVHGRDQAGHLRHRAPSERRRPAGAA